MKSLKYKYAPIKFIVQATGGLILLEQNENEAFYYKVDSNFNLIWEKKISRLIFDLCYRDCKLKIYDDSGEAILHPDTGDITNWIMTR